MVPSSRILGAPFFAGLLLLLAGTLCASERPPNVVILLADDMGFGDLGANNPQSKIPTPHLDQLCAEGTRFTDAHSSSGVCTPSRYALLHGRYHWRKFHGIVNSFEPSVLDPDRQTIASFLKNLGYQTACIGKWHLGWDWKAIQKPGAAPEGRKGFAPDAFDWSKPIPGGPLSHGFDYYFGDDVPNFPPYTWFENDRVLEPPTTFLNDESVKPFSKEGRMEARPGPSVPNWDFFAVMPTITQKAVDWIQNRDVERPFFLYMAFTSPHAPIVPTAEFTGRSKAGAYGDFVVQTDDAVGRILKALKEKGVEKNTLILFTSDNGAEAYAYDRIQNFDHFSSGNLRGVKRDLWEGGHHVPFIARWPGVVPAGKVSTGLLSQIDIFATVAASLGKNAEPNSAEDSVNQLELFKGGESQRTTLVHNTNAKGYALRSGDWVLIDAPTGGVSKVPTWFDERFGYSSAKSAGELYNLRDDPSQKQNLSLKFPEKVQELRSQLSSIRQGN